MGPVLCFPGRKKIFKKILEEKKFWCKKILAEFFFCEIKFIVKNYVWQKRKLNSGSWQVAVGRWQLAGGSWQVAGGQ